MVADGHGRQHRLFAGGLGAGVARGRILVGADRRDMHHPRADGGCGLGDRVRALGLHGVEGLRAALGQDADQIDGDVGIAHRGLDRGRIAQIGLHGVDLADPAERLQMPGQFRPPHRDPDAVIALGQRADHVSPQKARSAENRDQRVQIRCHERSIPAVKFERSRAYLADSRYANAPPLYSVFGAAFKPI